MTLTGAQRQKRLRRRREKAGLCPTCGKQPPVAKHKQCQVCIERLGAVQLKAGALLAACRLALLAWVKADLARQDIEAKLQDARSKTAALAELDPLFNKARKLTGQAYQTITERGLPWGTVDAIREEVA